MVVRVATPDDWGTLREVRLAALREAPYAFSSTYAREAPMTPEQWRGRLTGGAVTFLAFAGAQAGSPPAGLAGVCEQDGMADLVGMWVVPAMRGRGVGAAIIEAAAGWARARGHPALFLWVTEPNLGARGFYERCGFTLTGQRQPLPSDPSVTETRMRRELSISARHPRTRPARPAGAPAGPA